MATRSKSTSRRRAATKKSQNTKATTPSKKKTRVTPSVDLSPSDNGTRLEMNGEKLTISLSRDAHPEVFEIDELLKVMRKVRLHHKNKRKMRDIVQFLEETEKSIEIILSNHLEDALRKYIG